MKGRNGRDTRARWLDRLADDSRLIPRGTVVWLVSRSPGDLMLGG